MQVVCVCVALGSDESPQAQRALPGSKTTGFVMVVHMCVCKRERLCARSSLRLSVLISWPGEPQRLPRWSFSPLRWLVTDGKTETQEECQKPQERLCCACVRACVCERILPSPFFSSALSPLEEAIFHQWCRERHFTSLPITFHHSREKSFLQMMSGLYWAVSAVMSRTSIQSHVIFQTLTSVDGNLGLVDLQ